MRKLRTIQEDVLSAALKNLSAELFAMRTSEKAFLGRYRKARLHAFQLEFLSKFLRKSSTANHDKFEKIAMLGKELEDRLGDFNQLDELAAFCKLHRIFLKPAVSAEDQILNQRQQAYEELRRWMSANGWLGRAMELTSPQKIEGLLTQLESLGDQELRHFAAKKMAKTMRELQANVQNMAFDAKKKSGYFMAEVEPKVHEARREIRKIPMYASYLNGVFALTDRPNIKIKRAVKYFLPLRNTPLAKSEFAQLPKTRIHRPLLIPRPFFIATTKYISELGFAKDWAQNLERLRQNGLEGEINFNQLDPALKDAFGRPTPFNTIVLKNLEEMRKSKIFAVMADFLDAQE